LAGLPLLAIKTGLPAKFQESIMLPPGALKYLRGHRDGLVFVSVASVAASLIYVGQAVAGIALLTITLGLYHLRTSRFEEHQTELQRLKVDQEAMKVEVIKARHRDLLLYEQPNLPLVNAPQRPSKLRRER